MEADPYPFPSSGGDDVLLMELLREGLTAFDVEDGGMQSSLDYRLFQEVFFFECQFSLPCQVLYLGLYGCHSYFLNELNCRPETSEVEGILVPGFKSSDEIPLLGFVFSLKRIESKGLGGYLPRYGFPEEEESVSVACIHPLIATGAKHVYS